MRGYHEQREAENLLMLLKQSREMIRRFNVKDASLLAASGLPARSSPDQKDDVRLCWYLNLALEMETYRHTGLFAVYFPDAKRTRRHPYDLMAQLPLQEDETERAEIPAELLKGLDDRAADQVRGKYARMLRILPMRKLFERLSQLTAELHGRKLAPPEKLREKLLEILNRKGWRSPIDEQEEYGRQTLDIADNNFTIIERLIALHGKTLLSRGQVMLPGAVLKRSESPAVHIAAAVAAATMSEQALQDDFRMTDYTAYEGGHLALGLYGDGAPGTLFAAVQADQRRNPPHRRIVHTRRYCRFQLMRFSAAEARLFRRHEAEMPVVISTEALPAVKPQADWLKAVQEIHALKWMNVPEPVQSGDGLCLQDNGGNGAYRSLRMYLQERRSEQQQTQRAEQQMEQVSEEEMLRDFLCGMDMPEKLCQRAMDALGKAMESFFADAKMVETQNGDAADAVKNVTRYFVRNVGLLTLAYLCREEALSLEAVQGVVPAGVEIFLSQLREDASAREAFRKFCSPAAAAQEPRMVFSKFVPTDGGRLLLAMCPWTRTDSLNEWFLSGGDGGSFDAGLFSAYCLRGLLRHSFRRKSVAQRPALFQLQPSRQFAAEDKALHLVLAHFLLSRKRRACMLIVLPTDAEGAKMIAAGEAEQLVMTVCREICAMTEAKRRRLVCEVQSRCLSVLSAALPGQTDEVMLLPGSEARK